MTLYESRLLTPPREEEEIAPYRPVWRAIIIEGVVMFVTAIGLFVAYRFLGIEVPQRFSAAVNIGLALLPTLVWGLFSLRPERRVPQPRQRLLTFYVLTVLGVNGVVIPLVQETFELNRWLPQADSASKLLGFALTNGALNVALLYLMMRYILWPSHIRTRLDMIAYSSVTAIAYATISGLRAAAYEYPAAHLLAAQIFADYTLMLTAGAVIGYGVAESFFANASAFIMPFVTIIAAILMGVAHSVRSSLISSRFGSDSISGPNALFGFAPAFGLIFSVVFVLGVMLATAFFYANAEQRERESQASER